MGEFIAWIIGWDLILEYAVGAATVAIAWSEYANRVLDWFGLRIPYQWAHSPFEHDINSGVHGIMNMPAVFILLLLTLLLIRGTKESAFVNGIIVVLKVSIVLLVIGIGWGFINPANHTPLIPEAVKYTTPEGITHNYGGIMGILGAAGVVFRTYTRSELWLDEALTIAVRTGEALRLVPVAAACAENFGITSLASSSMERLQSAGLSQSWPPIKSVPKWPVSSRSATSCSFERITTTRSSGSLTFSASAANRASSKLTAPPAGTTPAR